MANYTSMEEFDAMRRRAKQRGNQATQEAERSIRQRFAGMGLTQSGMAVKQEQLARQDVRDNTEEEINKLNLEEAQTRRAMEENEKQRAFQSGESQLQREFSTSERIGSQQYQSEQLGKQQEFEASENLAARNLQNYIAKSNFLLQKEQINNAFKASSELLSFNYNQMNQAKNQFNANLSFEKAKQADAMMISQQQVNLNRNQIANSYELALKQIGLSGQQLEQAKDQFTKEFDQNLKTNAINTILSVSSGNVTQADVNNALGSLDILKQAGIDIEFDTDGTVIVNPISTSQTQTSTNYNNNSSEGGIFNTSREGGFAN